MTVKEIKEKGLLELKIYVKRPERIQGIIEDEYCSECFIERGILIPMIVEIDDHMMCPICDYDHSNLIQDL